MSEDRVKDILDKYSTPGLRRHELTRSEKRNHLERIGIRGADADKILNDLYGPEPVEQTSEQPESKF